MKLFLVLQGYAATIGVYRMGKNEIFNHRNVGTLFLIGLYFTSTTAFILTDASTFFEYANGVFVWITLLLLYFGLFNTILVSMDLFQFIVEVEKCIGKCTHVSNNKIRKQEKQEKKII